MNLRPEKRSMNNFQKINKEQYRDLLDRTLFKTFFHEIEWHEFLEREFKWLKLEYYLYNDELLFPLVRINKRLISLPFCEYGGPLPIKNNIDLEQFKKDVFDEFGQNIKIKFHPRIQIGDKTSDVSTHWIENLKSVSEQELWDSLRKTLRHEIKKAQENGLEVRRCKGPRELKQFYNLYVANLRLKKTIPYPWQVIQFLYQALLYKRRYD